MWEKKTTMDFKKFLKDKMGVFDQLQNLGIGIASLSITLAVIFLILSTVKANPAVAADGNATASLNTLITAVGQIPSFVPLVVIAAIGAIIIGLVSLFGRRTGE